MTASSVWQSQVEDTIQAWGSVSHRKKEFMLNLEKHNNLTQLDICILSKRNRWMNSHPCLQEDTETTEASLKYDTEAGASLKYDTVCSVVSSKPEHELVPRVQGIASASTRFSDV